MEDKEFLRRIIKEKLFWVVRWSRSFMKVKKKNMEEEGEASQGIRFE